MQQPVETIGAFRPVDDTIYNLSSSRVPIDKDTSTRRWKQFKGESGSPQNPLNGISPKQSVFDIPSKGDEKLRLANLGLRINMVMTAKNDHAATVPIGNPAHDECAPTNQLRNSPSWNMTGFLIDTLEFKINNKTAWQSNDFGVDFTARLLRNFTYETLNNADYALFTPVGSSTYTISSDATAAQNAVAANVDMSRTVPAILPAINDVYFENGADQASTGFSTTTNVNAMAPEMKERAVRWCSGAATHQRVITKIIPFSMLLPRFPDAIFRNIPSVQLVINWAKTMDLLEHTSTVEATHGVVRIINADVVADCYSPAIRQDIENLEARKNGSSEFFHMMATTIKKKAYSASGEIEVPSVKHFDSLMILQLARNQSNSESIDTRAQAAYDAAYAANAGDAAAKAAAGVAARVAFLAANRKKTYQSYGEFSLINNLTTSFPLRADTPQSVPTMDSVYFTKNGRQYPNIPIKSNHYVNGANCFDPTTAYSLMQLGTSRFGRREANAAIPLSLYKATMPYIYLRPHADDAAKMDNQASTTNLSYDAPAGPQDVYYIVFHSVVLEIDADGQFKICDM